MFYKRSYDRHSADILDAYLRALGIKLNVNEETQEERSAATIVTVVHEFEYNGMHCQVLDEKPIGPGTTRVVL